MYKTVFIESDRINPSKLSADFIINGDHLARDIQGAIVEYTEKGYVLEQMENINSSYSGMTFTQGMMLVFKKVKD